MITIELIPQHCQCDNCVKDGAHLSSCAVHNEPAYPKGKCDCRAKKQPPLNITAIYKPDKERMLKALLLVLNSEAK